MGCPGIEPKRIGLQPTALPIELTAQINSFLFYFFYIPKGACSFEISCPTGTWTQNPTVNSRMLCLLSYRTIKNAVYPDMNTQINGDLSVFYTDFQPISGMTGNDFDHVKLSMLSAYIEKSLFIFWFLVFNMILSFLKKPVFFTSSECYCYIAKGSFGFIW